MLRKAMKRRRLSFYMPCRHKTNRRRRAFVTRLVATSCAQRRKTDARNCRSIGIKALVVQDSLYDSTASPHRSVDAEPRSVSSLARQLGITKGSIADNLQQALRSARAAGYDIDVIPSRCKICGFTFDAQKLTKPSSCPACKGSRVFEPMIQLADA